MKRILAMFLTVVMIATACPMAFADEVTEESNITVTENLSEEAPEKEENIEETAEDPTAEEPTAENELTIQEENISLFAAGDDEVQYSTDNSTWTGSTLADAVTAIGTGTGTIKVLQDITLTATLNITGDITMVSDGADVTIKRAETLTDSPMVEVKSGATLTLGTETPMSNTLTFDGGAVWSGDGYPNTSVYAHNNTGIKVNECVIYNNQGTLNMYDNIVIENNGYDKSGYTLYHRGSGIGNDGIFNMYGGKIWKNSCYAQGETGGAVANNGQDNSTVSGVEFNMSGGEICYNTAFVAGGVSVGNSNKQNSIAEFNMTGGKIYKNSCSENMLHAGGGVYVNKVSSFEMTGGEISENHSKKDTEYSASWIGGIGGGIWAEGTVTVSGSAVVKNNTAEGAGDDIWFSCEDTSNSLTLPSIITADGKTWNVKWYYDGVKAGDYCDRYNVSSTDEKTDITNINTDQFGLKAVYTEILPEAEYSYSYYNSTEGFVTETKKGSFQDAVTAIKNSSNAGTIKILADSIDLKQTASFPYETTITSDHDVTFTKGFTGGPMFELPSAGSKNLVCFTADAGCNITIVGANDGDNPVFSMPTSSTGRKLELTNVTIQDNTVSGNGGAIRLTNNAGVKLTNVTIQNCSAGGFGGAVYHEDCGDKVGGVYCENVTFKDNQAKGGSAIYVDGVTGMSTDEYKGLTINGCTFTGNSSKNETASTPAEAVKLDNVIYVDCISGSFNQSVAAELKNTNTFTGNTTYSDINLGSNMATMSNFSKSVKLTDFSLSTDREGGKLKVVVGSYSVSGTAETCVFYTSVLTPDQLNTMAGNFSLTADKSGNGTAIGNKAILPHSTASYTLTVKEPVPQKVTFKLNGKKISATEITGGAATYNQDDYGNALSQGSFSMSSVDGATYAVTATPGHTITFRANLNEGYQVKDVTVAGASGSAVSVTKVDDTTYTFVMPNEEVTVSATVRKSSSITVVQSESGSITVTVPDMTMVDNKFTAVEDGTTVTLSATGDDFGKWSITNAGGTDVTSYILSSSSATSKDTSFTMPAYDITITAKVNHGIIVNADGGTYMVVKSTDTNTAITKAVVGDKIWVDLTPNTNYKLTGVTINKAGGGTVSYITYYNKAWHYDASLLESGCMVYFNMPDEAVTINVTFELDACEITTSATNGTITGITSPAPIGSGVTFTLTPDDDTYKLGSYKVFKTGDENTAVSVTDNGNGTYTFTMPEYPVTVSASFIKKNHDVTITKDGEGTVSISPETPVTVGETVTVIATPDENWELSTLTMNSTDITSTKSFIMPNEAVAIHAVFVKKKFAVTKSATENGTISIIEPVPDAEGNIKLDWDETVKINVTPDSHYDIDTVTVDGTVVTVDAQGDYSFTMPTHDVTISATFKKTKYSITGTGDYVTFDIPSTSEYDWGDTVEFTATPDQWYNIKSVTADNVTVTITKVPDTDNKYSFTMPQGDITITAVTERPNFSVTFASNGGSSVAAKIVANGDAVAKPEVPVWTGRGFAGWYLDEECTQKYDFTQPVTGNLELYARWFLWGDVNNDGVADSYDALLIRRCRVGLTDYSMITNRMAGFVNGFEEGRRYPDSGDAVSIRRYRVGLISRYKVEDSAAGYEFDLENDTYISNN